jgi:RNA polymerase sigma-70 factor (sigma-E family)
MSEQDSAFTEFVVGSSRSLRRTAFLLTGDWHAAEDLTQAALMRLYAVWGRVSRQGPPLPYARKTLVRLHLDERRRKRSTERLVPDVGVDAAAVETDRPEDRVDLQRALSALPRRQRAAVVLRYWDDLDVVAVAGILGCAPGMVKSLSSRGLENMRAQLGVGTSTVTPGEDG